MFSKRRQIWESKRDMFQSLDILSEEPLRLLPSPEGTFLAQPDNTGGQWYIRAQSPGTFYHGWDLRSFQTWNACGTFTRSERGTTPVQYR